MTEITTVSFGGMVSARVVPAGLSHGRANPIGQVPKPVA
jgi:hypothetical protein